MNTYNYNQEPQNGADKTLNTNKLTLDKLASLLREADHNAWVDDGLVAIKLDTKMIGLKHLAEQKALSFQTSAIFLCDLPTPLQLMFVNDLNSDAFGMRFYQQPDQINIMNIAACSEHFYSDECNVDANVIAGLLEHFLAEMEKARDSVDAMFVKLDKILDNLQDLAASRS